MNNAHSTLHTPSSTLHTPYSTLHTPYSIIHTPHSKLYTPHIGVNSPHLTLNTRHEREFPFPTFFQDSLINFFPTWVGNTVFHSHSQSKKLGRNFFQLHSKSQNLGTLFFLPIPNPNLQENILGFLVGNKVVSMHPFSEDNWGKIYLK